MKHVYKLLLWVCIAPLPAMASASREAATNEIFEAYNKTGTPGCAVGVYQDGQMAFQKGYGMASQERESSLDGPVSHNPAEHTQGDDLNVGANVLLHKLMDLAEVKPLIASASRF